MAFKKGESGYVNVNDGNMIDQAERYQKILDTQIARSATEEGKKVVAGALRWLDYCGTLGKGEPTLDGFHAWQGAV